MSGLLPGEPPVSDLPEGQARPCSRCGTEPRAPQQRWGRVCAREYARRRRETMKVVAPVRPAELPGLILQVVDGPDREALARYFDKGPGLDMLKHVLRFGVEMVRTRGYV